MPPRVQEDKQAPSRGPPPQQARPVPRAAPGTAVLPKKAARRCTVPIILTPSILSQQPAIRPQTHPRTARLFLRGRASPRIPNRRSLFCGCPELLWLLLLLCGGGGSGGGGAPSKSSSSGGGRDAGGGGDPLSGRSKFGGPPLFGKIELGTVRTRAICGATTRVRRAAR